MIGGCSTDTPRNTVALSAHYQPQSFIISIDRPAERALLHQPSRPAGPLGNGLEPLVKAMRSAVTRHGGDGLSAVQLGVPIRVVVLLREDDAHRTHHQVLVDPSIEARSPRRIGSWERCLSVPWGYRHTERSAEVTVHFRDLTGQWHEERISGSAAVVLQHELDHLDGLLLSDGLERQDFVPEAAIARVAGAAEEACREAGTAHCSPFMEAAWQTWRSAPQPSAPAH